MFWINPEVNIYHIGDRQPGDIECDQQPTPYHHWSDGQWIQGPLPVPPSVTPLQARRAMRQACVLNAVKDAVATDPEMQDAFDYATAFNRESTFIAQAQALLHWTDAQIDDLFRLAASFTD